MLRIAAQVMGLHRAFFVVLQGGHRLVDVPDEETGSGQVFII